MMLSRKKGFTLVEAVIAMGMAAGIIILVMNLASVIRGDVAKGTVDLQNLQEARLVINSLRRDFSSAIPLYDSSEDIKIRDQIRNDPMLYASTYTAHKSRPIILNGQDIIFCKTTADNSGNRTREEIHYSFDPVSKVLNRQSASGNKVFKGMESIKFDLYYHPLNDEVPMILVTMLIKTKEANETKELELTTTICSSIVNRDVTNLTWNWSGE